MFNYEHLAKVFGFPSFRLKLSLEVYEMDEEDEFPTDKGLIVLYRIPPVPYPGI